MNTYNPEEHLDYLFGLLEMTGCCQEADEINAAMNKIREENNISYTPPVYTVLTVWEANQ